MFWKFYYNNESSFYTFIVLKKLRDISIESHIRKKQKYVTTFNQGEIYF